MAHNNYNNKTAIAFLLTSIATWLIDKILDRTGLFDLISNLFISSNYNPLKVLNNTYPLWIIITLFIVFFILFNFFKRMLIAGRLNRRETQLIEIAKKYENYKLEKDDIIFKSKIYFDDDEKPFFDSWAPFCNRHEIPIKMTLIHDAFKCSIPICNHSIPHYKFQKDNPFDRVKNIILSQIIAEVENINRSLK